MNLKDINISVGWNVYAVIVLTHTQLRCPYLNLRLIERKMRGICTLHITVSNIRREKRELLSVYNSQYLMCILSSINVGSCSLWETVTIWQKKMEGNIDGQYPNRYNLDEMNCSNSPRCFRYLHQYLDVYAAIFSAKDCVDSVPISMVRLKWFDFKIEKHRSEVNGRKHGYLSCPQDISQVSAVGHIRLLTLIKFQCFKSVSLMYMVDLVLGMMIMRGLIMLCPTH